MKRLACVLLLLCFLLSACAQETKEYTVFASDGMMDATASFSFPHSFLLRHLTEEERVDPTVPKTREVTLFGCRLQLEYQATDRPTKLLYAVDRYKSVSGSEYLATVEFVSGTNTPVSASFGIAGKCPVAPTRSEAKAVDWAVQSVSEYAPISSWSREVTTFYTVSYQDPALDGATVSRSFHKEGFFAEADLPKGATVLSCERYCSLVFVRTLNSMNTVERVTVNLREDGRVTSVFLYNIGEMDSCLGESCDREVLAEASEKLVRDAYRGENPEGLSVSADEIVFGKDLDGAPYFEVSLTVEIPSDGEDNILSQRTVYLCETDRLEEKEAAYRARKEALDAARNENAQGQENELLPDENSEDLFGEITPDAETVLREDGAFSSAAFGSTQE